MTAVVDTEQQKIQAILDWLDQRVIGQKKLTRRLVMALLSGGHLLVEGAPGLAKTRAIKELAAVVQGTFARIQFTPDLLPSDVTGTEIFRPEDGSFRFQRGPIFHNLVLADEVNRAPAKVQSALLEGMAERQVSIGRETFRLPDLFMVMATQNPIEQEGTYPLPEAQLDRFLLHAIVDYPEPAAERQILALVRAESVTGATPKPSVLLSEQDVFAARRQILNLYMAPTVEEYLIQLIMATRNPSAYRGELNQWLEYGASPRGSIALDVCSRAAAWLDGREFVTPADVQGVAHDVLRHRIITTFEAEAQGIGPDDLIDRIIELVPVP
jgi:MoxR-like ATPase